MNVLLAIDFTSRLKTQLAVFFMTIEPDWSNKELTSLLFCLLFRKIFLFLQFVLSALFTLLGPCKLRCFRRVSPVIVLNISSGLKWAEHTRAEPFFIWQIRLKPQIIARINEGEFPPCVILVITLSLFKRWHWESSEKSSFPYIA